MNDATWFNKAAFAQPAAGTFGQQPRNILRNPGFWEWDLGIRKNFPVTEKQRLQFRTELFNVVNHPNWGGANANPTSGIVRKGHEQERQSHDSACAEIHFLTRNYREQVSRSMRLTGHRCSSVGSRITTGSGSAQLGGEQMTEPVWFSVVRKVGFAGLAATLLFSMQWTMSAQHHSGSSADPSPISSRRQFLDRYCATCHSEQLKSGGLSLVHVDLSSPGAQPELWEKVVRKLHTGVMPPPSMPQPSEADRHAVLTWLETSLDATAAAKPNPGRTETLRRLNRTEYQNAIRDLLALDIDATALLPADESGHGFDNVNVGDLSPTLLNRYISAAQKISRMAVGSTQTGLQSDTISLPADLTQEDQLPGLPIGTRGGVSTSYLFAQDGEYEIQVLLARDLAGVISGLRDGRSHEMLVLLDREPVHSFTISKASTGNETLNEKALKTRIAVKAGPHDLAVTFVKEGSSLIETPREPTQSRFNDRRHPRTAPAVDQISITGPYAPKGAGDTPSRRRLFVCRPAGQDKAQEEKCAAEILSTLMRRAYRRPVVKTEVATPMAFYRKGRAEGDFDAGITMAVSAVLTNPSFLFRVESDPKKVPADGVYRMSDLDLASRLSFFLWSSIPDDELLDTAVRGTLSHPGELEKQTRRMLADRRSFNLATNFAGQWLRLRNIDSVGSKLQPVPGLRRQSAARLPARNRALLRQRGARGPQRAYLHQVGLYISERAAGEALWDSGRLRKPVPPGDADAETSGAVCCGRAACCR